MDSITPHIAFEHWHRQRIKNHINRREENPYSMNEEDFRGYFRFTPVLAIKLIEELEEVYARNKGPSTDSDEGYKIPFDIKVLVALNFYATGSYQNEIRCIGEMSQSSVSKCIEEITDLLNILIFKYIKFPKTEDERKYISNEFAKKGIGGIIGLIDGTQVAICGLKKNVEMAYVNRKGFHSINVQIISDHKHLLLNVNARYPGSVHDSYIWGASGIYAMLANEFSTADRQKFWLLGDEGYPLMPFLITVSNEGNTEQHKEFYRRHKIIRSHVERTIGILKNRFRCIIGEKKLHYGPLRSAKIINAVAVLHNFLILNEFEDEFNEFDEEQTTTNPENIRTSLLANNPFLQAGRQVRERIINTLIV